MAADSVRKTFFVAFALCLVCSFLVSSTAVVLRPRQELNKELDIKKNLLMSAGLIKASEASESEIDRLFSAVEPIVIDLASGEIASEINPTSFDAKKSARNLSSQYRIPQENDLARLKVRSQYALIYLVKENETISQIVLPVHGKGLYSTLYGFLALAADTKTVTGFAFYDQGETPGLGGEVDNPRWKAQWPGKTVYDNLWQPAIRLVKGGVNPADKNSVHQVDAISGATMTSRGVENLLLYWLGENGYLPFLEKFRADGGRV
nr:Na(+)-translocating NADH-quinone reductase subunit C [Desulfobulbaceae bacterium]